MKSRVQNISEFICSLSFDRLPKEVVDNVKRCVLDAIGNTMGGLNVFEAKAIRSAIMAHDESPGATIWGIGNKVSVANAALVNTAAHEGMDFTAAGADASMQTTIVPAAIAVAEENKTNGETLITAITAALESQWRDENQTTMALSIGASEGFGPSYCAYMGEARGKVLFCGISGYMGVMAAYMAKNGLTSVIDVMEADGGFLGTISDLSKLDMTTWKLGEEFLSKYLCYKLYPCCRYIHPYIDAALKIRGKHHVKPENIEKMTAHYPPEAYSGVIRHEPPTEVMHAQFHLAWTVAAALIDGEVTIDTYTGERLKDPQIRELAQKLEYIEDPEMEVRVSYTGLPPFAVPGDLTVRMKDGREYTEEVEQPSGVAPTAYDDIYKKFERQAEKVLSKDRIEQIADACKSLERLEDVGDLVKLTVP